MTPRDFCFWLQSAFELADLKELNAEQVQTIKNHLKLVFVTSIDPQMSDDPVTQQVLQNIHDGKPALDGLHQNSTGIHLITPSDNTDYSGTGGINDVVFRC